LGATSLHGKSLRLSSGFAAGKDVHESAASAYFLMKALLQVRGGDLPGIQLF
jgi:hypothetical protein